MILSGSRTKVATVLAGRVPLGARVLRKDLIIGSLVLSARRALSSTGVTAATQTTSENSTTNIPDNIDAPLPKTYRSNVHSNAANSDKAAEAVPFDLQKKRLLTSVDMLFQIQDAPVEKQDLTHLDDQEVQYWARRMVNAITDLEQGKTRLRVTVIGESSGQESVIDLLMPSERNVRRSAQDTGRVHRIHYGSQYSLWEDGVENIEKAPISWLEGTTDNNGGELVEVPGLDLDDLSMDDIVYSSDLVLLRTDAQRQLSLEQEQRFLHRYRHKSHILIVADMNNVDHSTDALTLSSLRANLSRAVKSTTGGYSNIHHAQNAVGAVEGKVLRISNPDPIPPILAIEPPSESEGRYMEAVGLLQRLVAKTLMLQDDGGFDAQEQYRREALLTRCRELMSSGIEQMEQRLERRLETFALVDRLSELATEEIQRIEAVEQERMLAQVTDGEVDKDVKKMREVVDHFFRKEVPFWMLFARSGEIAERMHELWSSGAFAETEHRMAYALGRLHQSSQEAFRTTLKAMDELHSSLDQSKPIGSSLVLQDLTNARQLLRSSQSSTLQEIRDKDAFVVSNIVWKHRNAYGTPQSASWPTSASTTGSSSTSEKQEAVKKVVESSLEGGRPGVLERLQRRGQVVLAQGLGLQGTALFSGIGLAQQFPPEIYMTSGAVLSLVGLGYMQLRWKAAESEFKAETEVLADQLKQDIVDTYQDQVTKTIVKPLSSVVETLDKNLGDRLSRSLEQRKVLGSIKREAQSEEDILY